MNNDLINGFFELISALFSLLNIRRLYLDKEVKGVSILPIIFFTLWGFWNMYFYSVRDMMYSFIGGITITTCNLIWLGQLIYYKK